MRRFGTFPILLALSCCVAALIPELQFVALASAQEKPDESINGEAAEATPGHSYHGEAFNEGPRQQAYLMDGLGRANFPISSGNVQAQLFFNQAIDQLHGFWYFEAERSFRQVVVLDPECAMAYWGLAMANVNNTERAREFLQQAVEKSKSEKRETTDREKMYIEALAQLYKEKIKEEKKRAGNFVDGLEKIVLEYPDDIEAKAFLVCQLWMNQRKQLPINSHVAVNSLLDQIFEVDPNHPAHHYRIHLWDYKNAEVALHSAANCGPSLPDVAHMWHMPGHIYSKLKRYEDAVWQQEASARIDHRHMIHDQILPDQIHNFAHNNEWCVRNLNHVGRVQDAIDLAANMISMPRHPKYNHLKNRGSAWYGRQRLFGTLSRYELWPQLIEACQSAVLEPSDNELEKVKRKRYLGRALFRSGDHAGGEEVLETLRLQLAELKKKRSARELESTESERAKTRKLKQKVPRIVRWLPRELAAQFGSELKVLIRREHKKRLKLEIEKVTKELDDQLNVCKRAIQELEGYQLVMKGKYLEAVKRFQKAGEVDAIYRALVKTRSGDEEKIEQAIKEARKYQEGHESEVQPLANLCWLLWQVDKKDEAAKQFELLRKVAGSSDLQSPIFQRLEVVASYCKVQGDWRLQKESPTDLGQRPQLSSLGPFRWQPVDAPDWQLANSNEETVASKQFRGKPVVVIFYLGHGCLHCAEQLQKFAPMMEEFREAGIEMVAVSTDQEEKLKNSIESYGDQPLPIQLLADPQLSVFKAIRAYDEFENQPLHGTFLIDELGKIRWQDISYEPFMDPEFLLKESQRLLAQ